MGKPFTLALLFCLVLLLGSCAPKEEKKVPVSNWSSYTKQSFMKECVTEASVQLDSIKAKEICSCVLEKVIQTFPDTTKVTQKEIEEQSKAFIIKCLF